MLEAGLHALGFRDFWMLPKRGYGKGAVVGKLCGMLRMHLQRFPKHASSNPLNRAR